MKATMNIYPQQKIGKLTVLGEAERNKGRDLMFLVKCECGTVTQMSRSNLRRSVQGEKSCGCTRFKHGLWKTRSYEVWSGMIKRCTRESTVHYDRYGGRGIDVCERWMSFENFYADMGERPDGMSIERIDNDKGYSPENCRWATIAEQTRNRRSNVNITIDGETMCATDWARRFGVKSSVIIKRIRSGWDAKRAVSEPVDNKPVVEIDGVRRTVTDVAKEYGLPAGTLRTRLQRGWTLERALNQPAEVHRKRADQQ
jgi:hypothetical protein